MIKNKGKYFIAKSQFEIHFCVVIPKNQPFCTKKTLLLGFGMEVVGRLK
jgi:hypothetical protein